MKTFMINRWLLAAGLVVLVGLPVGCGREEAEDRPTVAVTIHPLASIVRELVGEELAVVTLLPPEASPHNYELNPRQMQAVADARAVIRVGLGVDDWAVRAAGATGREDLPVLAISDYLELGERGDPHGDHAGEHDHAHHEHADHDHAHHEHADHDHDGQAHDGHAHHGHAHGAIDPHVWLDPVLMRRATAELAEHLTELLPGQGEAIAARARQLDGQLAELDTAYREQLAPFQGATITTYHGAYDRLADRYGLRTRPLMASGAVGSVTADAIARVMAEGGVVFIEPQAGHEVAQALRERAGVSVHVLDPLGSPRLDDRDTYLALMRYNLRTLVEGLKQMP